MILMYINRGIFPVEDRYTHDGLSPELKDVLQYLKDVEAVKHSDDEHQVAMLVGRHKLSRDHVPTWLRKNKEVLT